MKSINNFINEALIKKDTKLDFLPIKDIFEYCRIYLELDDKEDIYQNKFKKAIEKWASDFDIKYVSYPIVFGESEDVVYKIKEIYKELNLDLKKVTFNFNTNGLEKYFIDTTDYFDGADLGMDETEYPALCGTSNSLNMSCFIITDRKYIETATIIFEKK